MVENILIYIKFNFIPYIMYVSNGCIKAVAFRKNQPCNLIYLNNAEIIHLMLSFIVQ